MINDDKVNIGMSRKWNNGHKKRSVHTTLKPNTIAKLEEYGDGKLNKGIEAVLEIAESKQNDVREQLYLIASHIINEEVGFELNLN